MVPNLGSPIIYGGAGEPYQHRPGQQGRPAPRPGPALLLRAAPARAAWPGALLAAVLLLLLAGCQWGLGGEPPARVRSHAPLAARWIPYRHVGTVVNLTMARAGGWLTVAAYGHLLLLGWDGTLAPFARGPGGYATGPIAESYIALARSGPVAGAGCSFAADAVFALQPRVSPGVIEVTRGGQAHRFASLPGAFPDGIAFDDVGRFGHRLLVTSYMHGRTSLFAIDCAGRITTISARLPHVEGGITVAPLSFGAYGGDLIAPDEVSGRIWAISPSGRAILVARSGLPTGRTSAWKAPASSRQASALAGRLTWLTAASPAIHIRAQAASCACPPPCCCGRARTRVTSSWPTRPAPGPYSCVAPPRARSAGSRRAPRSHTPRATSCSHGWADPGGYAHGRTRLHAVLMAGTGNVSCRASVVQAAFGLACADPAATPRICPLLDPPGACGAADRRVAVAH